jgi:hypothetical protein
LESHSYTRKFISVLFLDAYNGSLAVCQAIIKDAHFSVSGMGKFFVVIFAGCSHFDDDVKKVKISLYHHILKAYSLKTIL